MTVNIAVEKNSIDFYVPDQSTDAEALDRTTHLAIAAHQDDLEIIGFHGIGQCYKQSERWFTGIVLTDGAGSPRSGDYAHYSNDEMAAVRKQEQRDAADFGAYSAVIQYGCSSAEIKQKINPQVVRDLARWLGQAQAEVVYLHNVADRHDTHIAVSVHALEALRSLPPHQRPKHVYGVEGWRDLDWLPQQHRVQLDVGAHREIYKPLIGIFDSQISGGKRYDLASEARQLANATFGFSHSVDTSEYISLAMDLQPLLDDTKLEYGEFVQSLLSDFNRDLLAGVRGYHEMETV